VTHLLQLFSLTHMPKTLPPWHSLMADLGHPKPALVARALGVGQSSVYRWNRAGKAPRMASLAVYWLTRWGRSEIDTRATNDALLALALVRSLTDENAALRVQPARQGDCLRPANAGCGGEETRVQDSTSRTAITNFALVGTKTSPPFARTHCAPAYIARVARPMPKKLKHPRKG